MTKNKTKKIWLVAYLTVVFAVLTSFPLYRNRESDNPYVSFLLAAFIWFMILACFLVVIKPVRKAISEKLAAFEERFDKISSFQLFLISWGFISLCWILPYLALFPGTLGYDSPLQLCQYLGTMEMTDHHPVAHTVLLGSVINLGRSLFGSYNAGVALFTALQGLAVTSVLSYSIYEMRKRSVSLAFCILGILWMAFNPFLQMLSFNCTKDILFGVAFSYFVISFYDCLVSEDEDKKSRVRDMVFVGTFGIIMCLFRHQGVYIVAAVLVMALFLKKRRKETLVCLGMVFVIYEVYSFGIHGIFGYEAVDKREMLSVPMQQMAYVCKLKVDGADMDISEDQFNRVLTFISEDAILNYQPDSADPVKSEFDTKAFLAEPGANIGTYLSIGIHNSKAYIEAFKNMVGPYIRTQDNNYLGLMALYTYTDQYTVDIERNSKARNYYENLLYNSVYMGYRDLPLASMLFYPGLCIWLLFAGFGVQVYNRSYAGVLVVVAMLLYFMSLLLGPTALVRYLYPLILLVPFMVVLVFDT